ncbi:hypothetical protein [Shewanella algae]|uniref:hypothetical protein n=1 Tax=Shewanella algae TaxID=38313 RepID=UPI0011874C20|nr:hypothetical protein [Shewanella algae]TVO96282.1 hypothetical protein AYI86_13715 [Shewanella algae]
MTVDRWLAIIALIATIPIYKGWISSLLQWNKSRQVKSLKRQLEIYEKLKNDQSYFTIWATQTIILAIALVAAALMFNGVAVYKDGQGMAYGFISMASTVAYLFSVYKLGQLNKLKNYEQTIETLNCLITEKSA